MSVDNELLFNVRCDIKVIDLFKAFGIYDFFARSVSDYLLILQEYSPAANAPCLTQVMENRDNGVEVFSPAHLPR